MMLIRKIKNDGGYTLAEVIIVAGIIAIVTGNLLSVYNIKKPNLKKEAQAIVSDIRNTKAFALSARQVDNQFRCGYGLSWDGTSAGTAYVIYAGHQPGASGNCQSNTNNTGSSYVIKKSILSSTLVVNDFKNIYFRVPDGKMWIDNKEFKTNNPSDSKAEIVLKISGASCPSASCIYICVYSFGQIQVQTTACQNISP